MPACLEASENETLAVRQHGCPVCGHSFDHENWLPYVRIASRKGSERVWHFWCALTEISLRKNGDERACKRRCLEGFCDLTLNGFNEALEELVALSPDLMKNVQPRISISCEELSLLRAAEGSWPTSCILDLHPIAYQFQGLCELRVSSCSSLRTIPPEVGQMYGLQSLVFISDGLTSIPDEIGQLHNLEYLFLNGNFLRCLPKPVCDLPRLKEICLDANLITKLPPIASPDLQLFTAPANQLEVLPDLSPGLKRLEIHGNRLTELTLSAQAWPGLLNRWEHMQTLKIMGNHLKELPPEVGRMYALKTLLVANNNLRALPESMSKLQELQWLYAYDNAITEVPRCLLKSCRSLDRILLEGNPLTDAAVEGLMRDAPGSSVKTVGLDMSQVSQCIANYSLGLSCVPACIKIGSLIDIGDVGEHYYMKRVFWSQLVDPNCETRLDSLSEGVADNLVIAFSASQAEPEWLGVLARAARSCSDMKPLAPPKSSLADFFCSKNLGYLENELPSAVKSDARIAALWSVANSTSISEDTVAQENVCRSDPPHFKFDVLCLVDHCMSWYAADLDHLTKALSGVTKHYKRVICIGASMGGFGAILHGGRLADAIIAFGPQSKLVDAGLRPRAQNLTALQAATADLKESVRLAHKRGASIKIHCATDDHLWHALQLPLEDLALTVHPLCPLKPFARLLDRCKVLLPIVLDAFFELLRSPATPKDRNSSTNFHNLAACGGLLGFATPVQDPTSKSAVVTSTDCYPVGQISVACWRRSGGYIRFSTHAKQLIQLFFAHPATFAPRPGQWYCAKCNWRNSTCRFFCKLCEGGSRPSVMHGLRIPDGSEFPRTGDWGCGHCSEALFKSHENCTRCGTSQSDVRNYVVP